MSYKPPRKPCFMNINPLLWGARYVVCQRPGCGRVRRGYGMKPLIHKGGKP